MDNAAIAEVFDELAELLEFHGENPFRIRAYRNGSRAIRELQERVETILADPQRKLEEVPGIGRTLEEKIKVLVATGELPQLVQLRRQTPAVLLAMSRIPGLGAKKAVRLQQELGIESLDDLRQACEQNRVSKLKGFGEKTQQAIQEGISIAEAAAERIYWSEGDHLARSIQTHLSHCPAIERMEWAGSYRRGCETIGDLDLLVTATDRQQAMDQFEAFPDRTQTIARGETKVSIRVAHAFQVDMRIVEADEFGAALQYFTGSQAHNVHVRRLAKERGLKINEYGVFRVEDDARLGGASEQDVYASIGLPWIPPELREDRQEFEWASRGALPELVQLADIRGDMHMHTSETDGEATIREMADAAIARGLSYIAITDHSKRVAMAMGLDVQRLRTQWALIDEIRGDYAGRLEILKGIECDILERGGMDLPDDCLAEADWVLASIHYGQKQPKSQITDRLLGAVENPHVDCIAHPTGRLINRRPPYEVDIESLMHSVKQHGKLLELNAHPARLDLNDLHLAAARRLGIPIVISTDAHSTEGLNAMQYGVLQARRGGLTREDVLNTLSWSEFKKRLCG